MSSRSVCLATLSLGRLSNLRGTWKTKTYLLTCAQRRLKSAFAITQSGQSSLTAWRNFTCLAIQKAPSDDFDQTAWMRRLIWSLQGAAHVRSYIFWPCGSCLLGPAQPVRMRTLHRPSMSSYHKIIGYCRMKQPKWGHRPWWHCVAAQNDLNKSISKRTVRLTRPECFVFILDFYFTSLQLVKVPCGGRETSRHTSP